MTDTSSGAPCVALSYVLLTGERWGLDVDGCNARELFDRKARAVWAAIDAAKEQWTQSGQWRYLPAAENS